MLSAFCFQFNSSSCLFAFLLFCGLSALFLRLASSWPALLCFYMIWIPKRIWLRPCGAAVSRGFGCGLGVLKFRIHSILSSFSSMLFISPCFFCLILLSGSGASSPLHRGTIFLQSYNLQSCWSFVLRCPVSVGLWLESRGPIILYQPQTRRR